MWTMLFLAPKNLHHSLRLQFQINKNARSLIMYVPCLIVRWRKRNATTSKMEHEKKSKKKQQRLMIFFYCRYEILSACDHSSFITFHSEVDKFYENNFHTIIFLPTKLNDSLSKVRLSLKSQFLENVHRLYRFILQWHLARANPLKRIKDSFFIST